MPTSDNGYDDSEFEDKNYYPRDTYYSKEDVYHQQDKKKRKNKLSSNNSGKYSPYYQEQIPSTTVGIKTLP